MYCASGIAVSFTVTSSCVRLKSSTIGVDAATVAARTHSCTVPCACFPKPGADTSGGQRATASREQGKSGETRNEQGGNRAANDHWLFAATSASGSHTRIGPAPRLAHSA